ncbi:hypothetical protein, partial [Maritalea sp.]|uniref:hypothetical protein n=1 Tax=Maritalea sp. TaxID=2003361 RepID=UPI003EFA70D6
WLEQSAHNAFVVGSSPTGPTKFIEYHSLSAKVGLRKIIIPLTTHQSHLVWDPSEKSGSPNINDPAASAFGVLCPMSLYICINTIDML